jgi:hypothetical protein
MSDYFTGCEVCEANARTYGVMTAECKVAELEAGLNEANRHIAELVAAAQWRPIEEAPKDGKDWFIVARAGTPFRGPAYWFHGHWCQGNNAELHFTPTHFCELPDAPALPEGGAK